MSTSENLSGVPIMDLIDRLADPNKPYVTIDEPVAGQALGQDAAPKPAAAGPTVFQFSSSFSPGSPLAKELERRGGVTVTPDVESELHFTRFRIEVALDQLRPGDVVSIKREIAARVAREAELATSSHPPVEGEILGPGI